MSLVRPETLRAELRARDRAAAWHLATRLGGRDMSVWRLESFKAALNRAETSPGQLAAILDDERPNPIRVLIAHLKLVVAAPFGFLGVAVWLIWFKRFFPTRNSVPNARRMAAIHAEASNRTRHLLASIPSAEPPIEALILLGRVWRFLRTVKRDLAEAAGATDLPPLMIPASYRAFARAAARWPAALAEGVRQGDALWVQISFSEMVRMSFRVYLGLVQSSWWAENGPTGCEVLFGITGTADTTLLERAIQLKHGKTVHLVHGQVTGPNLIGVSSRALFRSGHDALSYAKLGMYGECDVQAAPLARPVPRGEKGLLLLTNLAHPMNGDYARVGFDDELSVLEIVARGAGMLGPLLWKPHPVSQHLAGFASVRQLASRLGFQELAPDANIVENAAGCRWVVSTPSTVAIELLEAGFLCFLLDLQGTDLDNATSHLPSLPTNPEQLGSALSRYDDDEEYRRVFAHAYAAVRPATRVDLSSRSN